MGKFFKYFFLILLAGGAGTAAYMYFKPAPQLRAISIVPPDAVFVLECPEPLATYDDLTQSALWTHLRKNVRFKEMDQTARSLDSLVQDNKSVFELFADSRLTVSAHVLDGVGADYLFLFDLQGASKLTGVMDVLGPVLESNGYKVTEKQHGDYTVKRMVDQATGTAFYLSFVDNLLTVSFSEQLVNAAIDEYGKARLANDPQFKLVGQSIDKKAPVLLYVNYRTVNKYLDLYLADEDTEEGSLLANLGGKFHFTGASFKLKDNELSLKGRTLLADTGATYMRALLESGGGKHAASKVIPARAAVYVSLGFGDFMKYYDRFTALLKENSQEYNEYRDGLAKVEKFLKISIEEDFLSWIGDEVALATVPPDSSSTTGEAEHILIIHANDIADAQDGLERIGKQIKKKTPLKFKPLSYKEDFTIYQFGLKGFFKLILGKLFARFDMPYYVVIDDYVIFSNQLGTLQFLIDDYLDGRTLAQDDDFQDFFGKFDSKGSLFAYLNVRNGFATLPEFVEPTVWVSLQANAEYAGAFYQMGFQFRADGQDYLTDFHLNYQPPSAETVEGMLAAAALFSAPEAGPPPTDGPYTTYYGNGRVQSKSFFKNGRLHGDFRAYYKNGNLKEQGQYAYGKPVGTWYSYGKNGKSKGKKDYGK